MQPPCCPYPRSLLQCQRHGSYNISSFTDLETACSARGTAPDTNQISQYPHVCAALNVDSGFKLGKQALDLSLTAPEGKVHAFFVKITQRNPL
jgi:hypothetical protein